MKKIGNLVKCALLALSIFAISSFEFMSCASNPSATAVPPDWLANYRVVYPASEYIAQRGSGVSKESAQNDAISKLARYVKTSVSSNMSSFVQTVTNGTSVEETFKDIDETTVSSQAELFALETTIPYYNASDKTWYCVAYIYREDAWNRYSPQVESAKTAFNSFYNKAVVESEPLLSLIYYKKAWECGKDLLEKLEFAHMIDEKREAAYQNERTNLAKVPSCIQSSIISSSMALAVSGDYGNYLTSAVTKVFSDLGFQVGGKGNQYTLEVVVHDNEIIENEGTSIEIFQLIPDVRVSIVNRNGKEIYSYHYKIEKALTVGSLETGHRKLYPQLADNILNNVSADFSKKFSLYL